MKRKNITVSVSQETYEAILENMKETGDPFVSSYVGEILDNLLKPVIKIEEKDLEWFKYFYFIAIMSVTSMLIAKKANNPIWTVLQTIFVPVNNAYMYTLNQKDYPLSAEMDMQLNDIANVVTDFVKQLKINECSLRKSKVTNNLNKVRQLLNLEQLSE